MSKKSTKTITGRIKNFFKAQKEFVEKEMGWVEFSNDDSPARINDQILMVSDRNWVYACIDKIAEAISGADYKLMKSVEGKEDEEVTQHDILNLLSKPSNNMKGSELLYRIAAHLELTGNSYVYHDGMEGSKNPTKLLSLQPENIKIKVDSSFEVEIESYKYTKTTKSKTILPEEMIHFKYPSPHSTTKGRGTLENIFDWVSVDKEATNFNRVFFKNGATIGGSLKTNADDKDKLRLAKAQFMQAHQGVGKAHKVSILPKDVEYVESKQSHKDMEFNNSLTNSRNNILSGFGVPKSVFGISEKGDSQSDAKAGHFAFMFFTIKPKITRIEEMFNEDLLPLFKDSDDLYIKFEEVVPEDKEASLEKRKVATGGKAWMTVNEAREEEGKDPIDGGDVIDSGDTGKELSFNKSFEERIKDKKISIKDKKTPLRIKNARNKKRGLKKITESVVELAIKAIKEKNIDDDDEEEILHKDFKDRNERKVDKFSDNIKDHDRDLKLEVFANLDEFQNPEDLQKKLKQIKIELFDEDKAIETMFQFSLPIVQDVSKNEGTLRYNELDVDGDFNPKDESLQRQLNKSLKLMSEAYTETTLDMLERNMTAEIERGTTMKKLKDVVSEVFEYTEEYRAERTARTEVFKAANSAGRSAFKQSGAVKSVKWHTAADEEVCQYCFPMNQKVVDIEAGFFEKGDTFKGKDGGVYKFDYDDVIDPPLHPNCRCFTLPEKIDLSEASAEEVAESQEIEPEENEEELKDMKEVYNFLDDDVKKAILQEKNK